MNNQQYIQTLCKNISTLRQRHKLTVEEMASRMGISVDLLAQLERGVMPENLEVKTLVQIEHEFGIALKDIFLPL